MNKLMYTSLKKLLKSDYLWGNALSKNVHFNKIVSIKTKTVDAFDELIITLKPVIILTSKQELNHS